MEGGCIILRGLFLRVEKVRWVVKWTVPLRWLWFRPTDTLGLKLGLDV